MLEMTEEIGLWWFLEVIQLIIILAMVHFYWVSLKLLFGHFVSPVAQ